MDGRSAAFRMAFTLLWGADARACSGSGSAVSDGVSGVIMVAHWLPAKVHVAYQVNHWRGLDAYYEGRG